MSKDKDRSRSKSPFRSFRWKKSGSPKSPSATAHSDDDANSYSERQSPGEGVFLEGLINRKHEWDSTTRRSQGRSWDKVYAVMRGSRLCFYKDSKAYKSSPETYYKNDTPLELRGGSTEVAQDYTKKKYVFRVKTAGGAEVLCQAKDEDELAGWVAAIASQCEAVASEHARAQTLPAGPAGGEQKRRSFFTLKKN